MSSRPGHLAALGTELHPARGGAWAGLFLRRRLYALWGLGIAVTATGMLWAPLMAIGLLVLASAVLAAAYEYARLSRAGGQLLAGRRVDERLSLGDDNPVAVEVRNGSDTRLEVTLLDELPLQLQERDFGEDFHVEPGAERRVTYRVRPRERGVYEFGELLLFCGSPLGLVQRRFAFGPPTTRTGVYPSIIQMRRQALRVGQLIRREGAEQRQRQYGRSYEFDQIKAYVPGDDYRLLNWKATARTGDLMLNTYVEERSQQVVALLDTSRTMLAPFSGLALLDHAINSTLALLNVALLRGDRVGLYGFDRRIHTRVPPAARPEHLRRILETLYAQQPTDFEPDYAAMYQYVRREVRGRSLLMLYTNFDTLVSLERQLPVLRQLSRAHLLVVVMFVNVRVREDVEAEPATLEDAYLNTVAAEYEADQQRIAATLTNHGILVLRTRPEELTANAVTRYLEVKRGGRL